MNIQPKIEPGSPSTNHLILHIEPGSSSTNHVILDRDEEDETHLTETPHNNFDGKTIPDLVEVLRGACLPKTFDKVETVLVGKDLELRDQIQLLQQNVEMEKLARLKAEEEVKKKEQLCEEGKKVQKRYLALMKEAKTAGFVDDSQTIEVLRKRNIELKEMWVKQKREVQKYEVMLKEGEIKAEKEREAMEELKKKKIELECEVNKLKEKRVVDGNAFDVLRTMTVDLEHEILELKEKKAEDDKLLDDLREKNGGLKNEVLELQSKVCVMENDRKGLAEVEIQNGVLENNLATLAEEKRKGEILFRSLNMKFKELHERVAKMEDDTELLMSVDVSGGGKNEGDPPSDSMVAEFGNDTVKAASWPKNEDAQLQNTRSKDPQASGRLKMDKVADDDGDDDDEQCMSRGAHENKTISGIAVKNDHPTPSSSIAVDMSKRKLSILDIETSSSDSSCDLSYLDNFASRFVAPEAKKKKM